MAQIQREYAELDHRSSPSGSVQTSCSMPDLLLKEEDSTCSSATGAGASCELEDEELMKADEGIAIRLETEPDGGPEMASILGHEQIPQDFSITSNAYPNFLDIPLDDGSQSTAKQKKPFRRWVQILHRRRLERHWAANSMPQKRKSSLQNGMEARFGESSNYRRSSSSMSSFAFVSAAREASMSLASTSIMDRSRRQTLRSSLGNSRADRSSRESTYDRQSEGSYHRHSQVDLATFERSLNRRRVIEELIRTEEGYIGDVRFLMNAYLTILASLPTLQAGLRSSIKRNLTDIVELHESLLRELYRVVPGSEQARIELSRKESDEIVLDAMLEDNTGVPWLQHVPGMASDPEVAARVARTFTKKMNQFFIYEEFGAQYELMFRDLHAAYRSVAKWDEYQKGLETLGSCIGSTNQSQNSRRALTISDLLTKPIQRVCRYPLLFSELLKYTPVCDCPYSYMEIENSLARLREVTGAMNRAADNVLVRAVLEKTWLLQDRLVFPNQHFDALAKSRIRSLGHIQLCGILHICWQTKDSVKGRYMVCLLYRDWLCFAIAESSNQIYKLQACLPISSSSVEEADNGRGLQCHTAPFSWKLVFECDFQLYEVAMTASNPTEEREWRRRLERDLTDDGRTQPEAEDLSFLALDIRSLGEVFGKPGTTARNLSIRRATTVGAKSPMCQVIVKNTSVDKDSMEISQKNSAINRSQSLQTNARIPVLSPSRADRARLEALISDVWTRDALPFPGMAARAKIEHPALSTASSAMRKLSVASLTSTFGRRSMGRVSIHKRAASFDVGTSEQTVPPWPLNRMHTDGVYEKGQLDVEGQKMDSHSAAAGAAGPASQLVNAPWLRSENEPWTNWNPFQPGHRPGNEPSETSVMTGSIKRTMARFFLDDEWQHQPEDIRYGQINDDGNENCNVDSSGDIFPPIIRSAHSDQSLRNARSANLRATHASTSKLPLYATAHEDTAQEDGFPTERKPTKQSSIRSLRRWSKTNVFHRGSLSQSFKGFLH